MRIKKSKKTETLSKEEEWATLELMAQKERRLKLIKEKEQNYERKHLLSRADFGR